MLEALGEDCFQDALHDDDGLRCEEEVAGESDEGEEREAHAAVADEESSDVEDDGGGAGGSTLALGDDGSAGDADGDVPPLSVEDADLLSRMTVEKRCPAAGAQGVSGGGAVASNARSGGRTQND